jgi:very-short-patch-repair endonuclease
MRIVNRNELLENRRKNRRAMPLAEDIIWNAVRADRLGVKFRRQHSFFNFIVDFYSRDVKLAIEIDGPSHDSAEAQRHDANRQAAIESLGVTFVRFTNEEVINSQEVVIEKVKEKIEGLRMQTRSR